MPGANVQDSYAPVGNDRLVNSTLPGYQTQPSVTFLADGRYLIVFQSFDSSYDVRGRVFHADGTPAGADFPVNTTADADQDLPKVAALAGGGFVVVWEDFSNGANYDIKARIYDANGDAGDEITITSLASGETSPSVAGLPGPGGGFVVTWTDTGDGEGDVRAQIWLADGSAAGNAFAVNTTTTGAQDSSAVTVLMDGIIVMVWHSDDGHDVLMRLFGPTGTPLSGELAVSSDPAGIQGGPCVVALAGGGFAVAWTDGNSDADGYGIRARIFEADGDPAGADFPVNTLSAGDQQLAAIAALPDGGFVVAWMDGAGPSTDDIRAQRFDGDGNAVDGEFIVNTHVEGSQYNPALAVDAASGALVVAWADLGASGVGGDDSGAIASRLFTPGGVAPPPPAVQVYAPGGGEAAVNTSIANNQTEPSIAWLANGDYVAVWTSDEGVAAGLEIRGRIFHADGTPLGADFVLNAVAAGAQSRPAVAAISTGFVLAYQSPLAGFDIVVESYDAAGTTTGAGLAHLATAGNQISPSIAVFADGRIVVSWTDDSSGSTDVGARVLNADLTPFTGDIHVNTYDNGLSQEQQNVAVLANGRFVIVWKDGSGQGGDDTSSTSIKMRIFGQDGIAVAATAAYEIQVNSSTASTQEFPAIAALGGGGFVIVWHDCGTDGDPPGIRARLYDADGIAVGPDFRVNATQAGDQTHAAVAALPLSEGGGFVVSWTDNSGGDNDVRAQRFSETGAIVGGEFLVNTSLAGSQDDPALAVDPVMGALAVAWVDGGSAADGSGSAIVNRLFALAPPPPAAPPPSPTADLNGAAPGIDHDGTFTEGDAGAAIGVDITVSAPNVPITGATITIADAASGDQLVLAGALPATITVLSGAGTAQLVLTGAGTEADWAAALAQVRYTTASDNPDAFGTDAARTISVVVSDGVNDSTPATATIAIAAVNDAPVVANLNGDAVTFTEGDSYVLLDLGGDATVSDVDSANFGGGRLSFGILSGGLAEDSIIVSATDGVSVSGNNVIVGGTTIGTIDTGLGELLGIALNASATPALVQTLMRAIGYANSAGDNPTAGARSIAYILTDGDGGDEATAGGVTVNVAAVNDAPDNTVPDPIIVTEDIAQAITGLAVADVDIGVGELTVTLSAVHGTLWILENVDNGLDASEISGNGTNTVVLRCHPDHINATLAALNGVVYTPDADYYGPDTLTMTSNDGGAAGADPGGDPGSEETTDTVAITVTAVNDAPTLDGLQGDSVTFTEDQAAVRLDVNLDAVVADVDPSLFTARTVGTGFDFSVFICPVPDGSGRVFVVDLVGRIHILDPNLGETAAPPFLDSAADVRNLGEDGMTGMATAPDFATSGIFYVFTANADGDNEVRRYHTMPGNPDQADPASMDVILTIPHPSTMHNGGWIGFGPDGFLYVATGDGGVNAGDAQDPDSLNGKILRIDVSQDAFPDPERDYAIPADNPFAGGGGRPEVWALGLRNPYRNSFDPVTGNLYIGDVGGGIAEEVNLLRPTDGGANFGWPVREGTFQLQGPDSPAFTAPVLQYLHGNHSTAILGGYVYRGPIEALQGQYIFGDVYAPYPALGTLWSIPASSLVIGSTATSSEFTSLNAAFATDYGLNGVITGYGVDAAQNFYFSDVVNDRIVRIEPTAEGNFAGGRLIVAITQNKVASEDRLQIDVSAGSGVTLSDGTNVNSEVRVGGTLIGVFAESGTGIGSDDLIIDFTSGATPARVEALLHALTYLNTNHTAPSTMTRTISYTLVDGGHDSVTVTSTVIVAGINDAPIISGAIVDSITEDATNPGGSSVASSFSGHFIDPDDPAETINGVAIVANDADAGTEGIWQYSTDGGTDWFAIGSVGADTALVLNDDALLRFVPVTDYFGTPTALGAHGLDASYSGGFTAGAIRETLDATVNGGSTAISDDPADIGVVVESVNDEPILLATGQNPIYTEDGAAVDLFGSAAASTVESGQTFTALTLTVSNVTDGAAEILRIDGSDVALTDGASVTTAASGLMVSVSLAGTTATLSFAGAALSAAQLQTLVEGLGYRNISQNPTGGDRVVTITQLVDSGTGGAPDDNMAAPGLVSTVNVDPVNDAPLLDLNGAGAGFDETAAYTENAAPVVLAPLAALTDIDSADFDGGTFLAEIAINPADSDVLDIHNQGTGTGQIGVSGTAVSYENLQIGTLQSSGPEAIVILLNANATPAALQALARAIVYQAVTEAPDMAPRGIVFSLTDGDGGTSVTRALTLDVTAVDDAAVAHDDGFTIDEAALLTGNVFDDHGAGADVDVDGPPPAVSAVNGSALVGQPILLASGALLTLNEDGSFAYDTNHAFDATPAAGSGASNLSAPDSFSYTLAGGSVATVRLTVTGLDTNDLLLGTAGDDVMSGGTGNDSYFVEQASDLVVEAANQGTDIVYASASYALAAGSHVEILSTTQNSGTGAIDLTGNEIDNVIYGNNGVNALRGGGGNDVLIGLGGNDVYYITDNRARAIEAPGEGTDLVYTNVSYALEAGSHVEILSTTSNAGTAAIDLTGNDFANTIYGNNGVNTLRGGGGSGDKLIGLGGNDTYIVQGDEQVFEASGGGTDIIYTNVSHALASGQEVEILSTTSNAGTSAIDLTGNEFANTIYGNNGANALRGGGGSGDVLIGLGGNDTYVVQGNEQVFEASGGGTDIVYTSVSHALASGQEVEILSTTSNAGTSAIDLTGNAFANTIYGNNGANALRGGGGSGDVLIGLGGNDTYIVQGDEQVFEASGGGTDIVYTNVSHALASGQEVEILSSTSNAGTSAIDLTGNGFANTIYGNNGANMLNGGAGNDVLVGAGGADTFAFTTALGAGNVDQIADFVSGTDKIALDDAVFNGLGLGALPAGAFVTGSAAGDADDRILYDSANGNLYYDADGTGAIAAILFANLQGHPTLTASDFLVI